MNSPLIGSHGIRQLQRRLGSAGDRCAAIAPDGATARGGSQNLFIKTRRFTLRKDSRTEAAVEAGLRWLARHQSADGSWSPDGFTAKCQGARSARTARISATSLYRTGATGLALLAFLGAGHDHQSQRMIERSIFPHKRFASAA